MDNVVRSSRHLFIHERCESSSRFSSAFEERFFSLLSSHSTSTNLMNGYMFINFDIEDKIAGWKTIKFYGYAWVWDAPVDDNWNFKSCHWFLQEVAFKKDFWKSFSISKKCLSKSTVALIFVIIFWVGIYKHSSLL